MASILRFDNWQNSDGTSIATTDASGNISFAGSLEATGGVGKILQVVRATDTTNRTTSSTAVIDADISVTITPTSASSSIIVIWSANVNPPNGGFIWQLITDSSNVPLSGPKGVTGSTNITNGAFLTIVIAYDTPATTSATTYKGRWRAEYQVPATIYNSSWYPGQMYAIEVSA